MSGPTSDGAAGRPVRPGWVHLAGPVTSTGVRSVAAQLSRSQARLVITDVDDTDLAFLADLPPLHTLEVILSGIRDVRGLTHQATSLRHLNLELGRHPVAVDAIGTLLDLETLYLRKNGPAAVRNTAETVAQATKLSHLVLHSVTIPSLAPLTSLAALRGLALKLGGAPDLAAFPDLPTLRFFEAWQVRGLEDLSPVAASGTVEVLWMESLSRVTLPDFSAARSLAHVRIDNCPLPGGLAGLAAAPALRQVVVTRRRTEIDEIAAFRGHPTLQAAWVPLSGRQTTEEEMRLGLGKPDYEPFDAFGAGVMSLPPSVFGVGGRS